MKKILVAMMLAALILLTACGSMTDKDDILTFAQANEEQLISAARRGNYAEILIMSEVFHAYYDMDCVVFTTGASGILTDTRSGLYYSFDGEPCGAGYANKWKLTEEGSGWAWYDIRSASEYYTEHLFGNFYYFEGTW